MAGAKVVAACNWSFGYRGHRGILYYVGGPESPYFICEGCLDYIKSLPTWMPDRQSWNNDSYIVLGPMSSASLRSMILEDPDASK